MCVSLRETRRKYVHVASSSTSLSPTVSRRDTHILPPPQARRPASGAEASIHPLGLASWKGHARGGTVGDRMSTTSPHGDRKSVVEGKSVSVRVDLGGRRIM